MTFHWSVVIYNMSKVIYAWHVSLPALSKPSYSSRVSFPVLLIFGGKSALETKSKFSNSEPKILNLQLVIPCFVNLLFSSFSIKNSNYKVVNCEKLCHQGAPVIHSIKSWENFLLRYWPVIITTGESRK